MLKIGDKVKVLVDVDKVKSGTVGKVYCLFDEAHDFDLCVEFKKPQYDLILYTNSEIEKV